MWVTGVTGEGTEVRGVAKGCERCEKVRPKGAGVRRWRVRKVAGLRRCGGRRVEEGELESWLTGR